MNNRQVFAWSLWDWGSAAYHAVILGFVFSVYLTDGVGDDLPGSVSPSTWLAVAMGVAGFFVAILAPVTGQYFDALAKRKLALGVLTGATVTCIAAMYFVYDDYHYLALGLVLLAVGAILVELAQVPYNAMLRQVSTPDNLGRISGFGWAMGYFGGIALLLLCYVAFIAGDGDTRGLFEVSTEGGHYIRLVALVAAVWFAVSAIPVLFAVPEVTRAVSDAADPGAATAGFFGSYRVLWRDVRELWAIDRRTVWFLFASALFRDGLTGVFTFGAVLAVSVYGLTDDDVLLFGIAANVVAAVGAIVGGRIEDRVGPKAVIVWCLIALLAVGVVLMSVRGPLLFWIFALALCVFIGPAQSSSRTFLARLTPPGREGQMFGLYATTGRAVSFLAPTLFALFAFTFATDRAGIAGLLLVAGAGLAALLAVRAPAVSASVSTP